MTERKPRGQSWESFVDRQIREARERGEFDNLPGAGKPIPGLGQQKDPLWWVRSLLEREKLPLTPPILELRREIEKTAGRLASLPDEDSVRRVVLGLNRKIAELNAKATTGPASSLGLLDEERWLQRWRAERP